MAGPAVALISGALGSRGGRGMLLAGPTASDLVAPSCGETEAQVRRPGGHRVGPVSRLRTAPGGDSGDWCSGRISEGLSRTSGSPAPDPGKHLCAPRPHRGTGDERSEVTAEVGGHGPGQAWGAPGDVGVAGPNSPTSSHPPHAEKPLCQEAGDIWQVAEALEG